MDIRYCSPEKERDSRGHYIEYRGFHMKPLRIFDSEYEAQQVAATYGAEAFYCEWGRCWHIGGGR